MFIIGFFRLILIGMVASITILVSFIFNGFTLPKKEILKIYDGIIQTFSTEGLSKDYELEGKRKFGIDKYVGTYIANYDKRTGTEVIFGGTSLQRKNGDHILLKIKVKAEEGNISVVEKLENNEVVLIKDTGEYEDMIYIEGMSYYLTLELNKFRGSIDIMAQ